jgi:hypothetical protein
MMANTGELLVNTCSVQDVLLIVPRLHAQPPMPPPSHDKKEFQISMPPSQGYDLVFQVLVDGLKDAKEKLAPIMLSLQHSNVWLGWGMVVRPREGLGAHVEDSRHSHGFSKGYEEFDKELFMELDIDHLMHDI